MTKNPKVFISYSWDDDTHIGRVEDLANSLRKHGVNCTIDAFKSYLDDSNTDWETWIDTNLKSSDYVLAVCTKNYQKCFDNKDDCNSEGGVKWEAELLRLLLKKNQTNIYTIIFNDTDKDFIPIRLSGKNRYLISYFNLNDEDSDYCKLYRELTEQLKSQPDDIGKIVVLPTDKDKQINQLISFIENIPLEEKELKDISKLFLEEHNNHRQLDEKSYIGEIIDYLDALIVNGKEPLPCIIHTIKQIKNIENQEINRWSDKIYDSLICEDIKQKAKIILDKKYALCDQNAYLKEDRIILHFEESETSTMVDLYIHFYENGRFISNENKVFKNKKISCKDFQKSVIDEIYDELDYYESIEVVLPKKFLLEDVKQWCYEFSPDIIKCFTQDTSVNIHIKERVFRRNLEKLWNPVKDQLGYPIDKSMRDMVSISDNTFGLNEVGLKYRFLPEQGDKDTFADRVMRKMIVLRCSDKEKLEDYNSWLSDNKHLTLIELKKQIDKYENSHMTLIWDDPHIPLKGDGIDAE